MGCNVGGIAISDAKYPIKEILKNVYPKKYFSYYSNFDKIFLGEKFDTRKSICIEVLTNSSGTIILNSHVLDFFWKNPELFFEKNKGILFYQYDFSNEFGIKYLGNNKTSEQITYSLEKEIGTQKSIFYKENNREPNQDEIEGFYESIYIDGLEKTKIKEIDLLDLSFVGIDSIFKEFTNIIESQKIIIKDNYYHFRLISKNYLYPGTRITKASYIIGVLFMLFICFLSGISNQVIGFILEVLFLYLNFVLTWNRFNKKRIMIFGLHFFGITIIIQLLLFIHERYTFLL